MSPDDQFDFVVSMGHGAYTLGDATTFETVIWDQDHADRLNWDEPGDTGAMRFSSWARFSEVTGYPVSVAEALDLDLGWEMVAHIHGDRRSITAGLVELVLDLGGPVVGDDDTFDYWPSGVRYALAVAAQLDAGRDDFDPNLTALVTWVARGVIFDTKADFADELLDKTGLRREGDA